MGLATLETRHTDERIDRDTGDSQGFGNHPAGGEICLPALTVNWPVYCHNRDQFLNLLKTYGAQLAPHAKTPMCPEIAVDLIDAGAWGATAADLHQARELLEAGIGRVLIANQIGGAASARRLRSLVDAYPDAAVSCFADSRDAATALANAFEGAGIDALSVLIEVGHGRTGARTAHEALALVDVLTAQRSITIAGIGTYEGAVTGATPGELDANMQALFSLVTESFARLRAIYPGAPLIISAGGSVHFDRVLTALGPVSRADGNAALLLRSGAIFFADHGVYQRGFAAIDERGLLTSGDRPFSARSTFVPAMRVWAEVISVPEPDLAIVGMGMRDVSFDQDLPVGLALWRDGAVLDCGFRDHAKVVKLNDQHAFVRLAGGAKPKIGDVVEFGISHPCTCFDRWRRFYGTDSDGRIDRLFRTFFH